MKNWGECYFDHYGKFFGKLLKQDIFRQDNASPSIQSLSFAGVDKTSRVFASLGLTHYATEVGGIVEAFTIADKAWDKVPYLLASSLFHAVQQRMTVGWGMAISNLDIVEPQFVRVWRKESLYLTLPYAMPIAGQNVKCGEGTGRLMEAFFITQAEKEFFLENGAEAFEALLQDKDVPVFSLGRESAV